MIDKIKKYYEENGIYPLNFKCKFRKSCKATAKNREKFTTGHGSYIGPEYNKGKVPRLLFLSLDPGSSKLDPKERTIEELNKKIDWLPEKKGDKNKHWYRTHQFTWHVFNEINKVFSFGLNIGKVNGNFDFNPIEEIDNIRPYFAHANSAKCCMNNKGRTVANPTLFKNCRDNILGELKILDPDILVTQGNYAWNVANKIKKSKIIKRKNFSGSRKDDFIIMELPTGKTLLWIHHYHPSSRPIRGEREKPFNKYNLVKNELYAQKAAKFIKEYYGEKYMI